MGPPVVGRYRPVPGATCTVCGRRPIGRFSISHHGERTCGHHPVAVRCQLCCRPTDAWGPGWADLGAGRRRCPTCSRHAVDTEAVAQRLLPTIRAHLGGEGFALRRPVRVVLVDGDALGGPQPGGGAWAFGVTTVQVEASGRRVLEVRVLRGLTPAWFGRTIVHENMHAWLAEQGIGIRRPAIEEGLCELVACDWLATGRTMIAAALVRRIEESADPVYGDGYRAVRAAVDAHGLAVVMAELRRSGTLPTG